MKMKISGQTQGKLVFAYDIREGHIDYPKLLPALQRRMKEEGYTGEATAKDLEELIGEILFRTNEKVFENMFQLLNDKKFTHSNIEEILEESMKETFHK